VSDFLSQFEGSGIKPMITRESAATAATPTSDGITSTAAVSAVGASVAAVSPVVSATTAPFAAVSAGRDAEVSAVGVVIPSASDILAADGISFDGIGIPAAAAAPAAAGAAEAGAAAVARVAEAAARAAASAGTARATTPTETDVAPAGATVPAGVAAASAAAGVPASSAAPTGARRAPAPAFTATSDAIHIPAGARHTSASSLDVLPVFDIPASSPSTALASSTSGIQAVEHHVEVDPNYRRKQLLRAIIVVVSVVVIAALAFLIWHFARLVEVPELAGRPIATAQTFSRDYDIELEVTQEYDRETDQGVILAQGVPAGNTISRGSTLALTVSRGPDPDERLALPNFSTLKRNAAERWIQDNRADNLRMVQEYSDTVADGDFLRLEFRGTDVTAENYRRRDYATLYYSRGAEVFEKNITVPDFAGKMRSDVESWAQTNSLKLTVEEADSDTVDVGGVISQSVQAGEKVAKQDEFSVTVSLGKPIIVPNFANYTAATAASGAGQVSVVVETRYHSSVAYGYFISQSVPAGTRLMPGDARTVTVVYSEGRPYLKDYRGSSEGDLPAAFFNDYTVKGANVTYELRYVDSSEPKGSVVGMSDYSRFIPLWFHVVIDVSLGNLPAPPAPEIGPNTNLIVEP
jgi:serine/threonine-protein kinase